MIRANKVKKSVSIFSGEILILKGITLDIKEGDSVAIVGASGSGKSTLLGLLAGLDDVSEGEIFLAGENITTMNEEQRSLLRGKLLGFVFQNFQLLSSLTAIENVMLPLELQKNTQAKEQAEIYLAKVGLSHRLNHYPRQLSGGEQQRVAIARAFVTQPRILFADEPTGNLDKKTSHHVIDLLFDLNEQLKTTLVLVTHDVHLAARCGRRLWMDDGELSEHEN